MLQTVADGSRSSRALSESPPPAGVMSDIVIEPRRQFRDLSPSEIDVVTGGDHAHPMGTVYDSSVFHFNLFGYQVDALATYHYDVVMLCGGRWIMTGSGGPSVWIEHVPQNIVGQNMTIDYLSIIGSW